jgi:hypothetical protein
MVRQLGRADEAIQLDVELAPEFREDGGNGVDVLLR